MNTTSACETTPHKTTKNWGSEQNKCAVLSNIHQLSALT